MKWPKIISRESVKFSHGIRPEWFNSPSKQELLSQVGFLVIDAESTGLNTKTDRIIQLAALKIDSNEIHIADSMEILVRQDYYNPKTATIHHIMQHELSLGTPEQEALGRLFKMAQNRIIVGHNVQFDIDIISQASKKYWNFSWNPRCVDTMKLARRVWSDLNNSQTIPLDGLTLEKLCNRIDLPILDAHQAIGDAFMTALLFLHLKSNLEKRGARKLADLL